MSELTELLPCPFCGGGAVLIHPVSGTAQYVVCKDCHAGGPPRHRDDIAINDWNRRDAAKDAERDFALTDMGFRALPSSGGEVVALEDRPDFPANNPRIVPIARAAESGK